MNIGVIKQVAALPGMSTSQLKELWQKYNGTEPPPHNRAFLLSRLAYRIQELALGGLPVQAEKRMERTANEDAPQEKKRPPGEQLLPGTRLIREWKGVEHCCTVLSDGAFEYQGRRYGSLSATANAITGSKWNGLVFWGLKRQGE